MSRIFTRFASNITFKAENPEKIKQLLKPIGQLTKPSTVKEVHSKTFKQRKDEFLDVKQNKIRRQQIEKEFSKSTFEHIYGFRATGGKIFTAPPAMFPAAEALYMPNIWGQRLDDSLNSHSSLVQLLSNRKPNVVRLFSSAIGQQQIKQYTDRLDLRALNTHMVDVNIPTSWVNRMLVKFTKNRIRRSEIGDNADIHKYLIAEDKLDENFRASIGAFNELAAYVYIVDKAGKIRWATSGPEYSNEEREMLAILKHLNSAE